MRYMGEVANCVETKIAKVLPEKFVVVFDVW